MRAAPLRIGLVAPLWYPVAADRGGIEQVIFLLARELVAVGHDVTLLASGDSVCAGHLVPVCPEGVAPAMEQGRASDYSLHELATIGQALRRAPEVDVLHSHLGTRLIPFAAFAATPVVHTVHTSISRDMRWLVAQFPGAWISTVSCWQAAALDGVAAARVIPNGIDLEAFPFSPDADDYLLVLGRIEARKGIDAAIDASSAAGRRLVIAGSVADRAYFETRIRPRLDGERVRWVGAVSGAEKVRLLQRAHGLLFTVQWEEAFGLVMIEAMACGTPVVALTRGAVPEIVSNGTNGYHAPDAADLPALIAKLDALERARVRASVEGCYSHRRMVAEYVALYRHALEGATCGRAG
jgi:glycosyltransferase involved in cell wall biosynthesis